MKMHALKGSKPCLGRRVGNKINTRASGELDSIMGVFVTILTLSCSIMGAVSLNRLEPFSLAQGKDFLSIFLRVAFWVVASLLPLYPEATSPWILGWVCFANHLVIMNIYSTLSNWNLKSLASSLDGSNSSGIVSVYCSSSWILLWIWVF